MGQYFLYPPAELPLTGTEIVGPIDQNGLDVRTTAQDIANLAPASTGGGGTGSLNNAQLTGIFTTSYASYAAAGTDQSSATPITTQIANFNVAAATTPPPGGILPAAGDFVVVFNTSPNTIEIYPPTNAAINGGQLAEPWELSAGATATFFIHGSVVLSR